MACGEVGAMLNDVLRHVHSAQGEKLARSIGVRVDLMVFLLGLLALVFGYGVGVGKGLLFPCVVINNAIDAARDWRENWRQYLGLRSEFVLPTARTPGGVTRHDPAAAWPRDTLPPIFHDGRIGAVLVDVDGRALHRWDVAVSRVWPGQTVFDGVRLADDDDVDIHGTACCLIYGCYRAIIVACGSGAGGAVGDAPASSIRSTGWGGASALPLGASSVSAFSPAAGGG